MRKNKKSVRVEQEPKVLFVIDTLEVGGAEQSLLANTARFEKVGAVVCHLYGGESLKPEFLKQGIPVHSLDIEKKYGFAEAYRKLKRIVEQERPQLLVAYLTRSELVTRMVGRSLRIPVVGTFVSDLYGKTYNQHLSTKAKLLVQCFRLLNKITAHYCAGFVANSQAIKESNAAQLWVPLNKITVINRGRDSSLFQCSKKGRSKGLRFVNVSRLFPAKAHQLLIKGFAPFAEQYPEASLDIIGDGPERSNLQGLIAQLGLQQKVQLLGRREDVPQLLPQYDLFLFPSLAEGFSGALVEAQFACLPVLASDIAANKEVVSHGETGWLFQSGSPEAITAALHWFVQHREEARFMAEKGNVHAKAHFEIGAIARQFENYLHQCITADI